MAPTYKPIDAITFSRANVKGIPTSAVDSMVCDFTQTTMWDYFPWNFTLKQKLKVNDAFLTDGIQDVSGVPTDFYRLIWARLKRTDLTDGNHHQLLTPVDRLEPADPDMYFPYNCHEFIAYHPDIAKFRIEGKVQIVTGELTQLDIEYQKAPTKITDATLQTTFADMPDWFFQVYTDGVLWRLMVLANDKRQGSVQVLKNGSRVYNGQMGVFYNGMEERVHSERKMYGKLRYPAEGSLGAR